MGQLSGNGLVSYFLNKGLYSIGITSSSEQLVINGCLMIYNFMCVVFFARLVERLGRRFLFLMSCGGMLLTYISWLDCAVSNQSAARLHGARFIARSLGHDIPLLFVLSNGFQ